jgi:hypothetical protein
MDYKTESRVPNLKLKYSHPELNGAFLVQNYAERPGWKNLINPGIVQRSGAATWQSIIANFGIPGH